MCKTLNVPLSLDKLVQPSTRITYLGIQIDTTTFTMSLQEDKLKRLKEKLSAWDMSSICTKKDLLSLIGFLSFACKVVKPGRMFLRRLIDLSSTAPRLKSKIHMSSEALSDIQWWRDFIGNWNGRELVHTKSVTSAELSLYTDASTIGMGGVMGRKWFAHPWPSDFKDKHIQHAWTLHPRYQMQYGTGYEHP